MASSLYNRYMMLTRQTRFLVGLSWIAAGGIGTYFQSTWEGRVLDIAEGKRPFFSASKPAETFEVFDAKFKATQKPTSEGLATGVISDELMRGSAIDEGECDCAPLWKCMQEGGDCAVLDAQLRACMAAKKSARK